MASIVGYTKTKLDSLLGAKVPTSRQVAGHPLNADVTVSKSDVGLGNADNTSDAAKPISDLTQDAIDGIMPVYVLAVSDPDPSGGSAAGLYVRRLS